MESTGGFDVTAAAGVVEPSQYLRYTEQLEHAFLRFEVMPRFAAPSPKARPRNFQVFLIFTDRENEKILNVSGAF